jgi:hypothetical protein
MKTKIIAHCLLFVSTIHKPQKTVDTVLSIREADVNSLLNDRKTNHTKNKTYKYEIAQKQISTQIKKTQQQRENNIMRQRFSTSLQMAVLVPFTSIICNSRKLVSVSPNQFTHVLSCCTFCLVFCTLFEEVRTFTCKTYKCLCYKGMH